MKRLVFGLLAILASIAATSCASAKNATTVEVEIRVNVCAGSGACYTLRVPDAEVVVNAQGGRQVANAKSGDDGVARLRLDEKLAGPHTVVATTPLWKDKEKSYELMVVSGSMHQLTLTGSLG